MQYLTKTWRQYPIFKWFLVLFTCTGLLLPLALWAKVPIPLEVETKSPDLAGVQEALIGGFVDIIQATLEVQETDYMEFILTPNGFITNVEHRCAITFQSRKGGLMIKAVPFDVVNGQAVEVLDFGVRKGVFLIIEGAAQEMDYDIEMAEMGGLGGFGGF